MYFSEKWEQFFSSDSGVDPPTSRVFLCSTSATSTRFISLLTYLGAWGRGVYLIHWLAQNYSFSVLQRQLNNATDTDRLTASALQCRLEFHKPYIHFSIFVRLLMANTQQGFHYSRPLKATLTFSPSVPTPSPDFESTSSGVYVNKKMDGRDKICGNCDEVECEYKGVCQL